MRPKKQIPVNLISSLIAMVIPQSRKLRSKQGLPALIVLPILLAMLPACGSGSKTQTQTTPPEIPLTRLSTDTFTNSTSQHATEVEPDTFAFGSTIVSAFQVGRIFSGGGADIGFATSTNGGATWTSGFLPGITTFQGGGTSTAASDAAVAFDAAHSVWIISSLAIGAQFRVLASRSSDGLTWQNPVTVTAVGSPDKDWIACDNTAASPFFGHCYVEWDDPSANGLVWMSTSTDGVTWTAPARIPIDAVSSTADHFVPGLAFDPVTSGSSAHLTLTYYWYSQANCTFATCALNLGFVTSQDGGNAWSAAKMIAGPMSLAWLPDTFSGRMVADYISTSYSGGKAFAAFALVRANSGAVFDEAIYTTTQPLASSLTSAEALRSTSKNEKPVANAKSDHGRRKFYDEDGEYPIPPRRKYLRRSARR